MMKPKYIYIYILDYEFTIVTRIRGNNKKKSRLCSTDIKRIEIIY